MGEFKRTKELETELEKVHSKFGAHAAELPEIKKPLAHQQYDRRWCN